MSSSGGGGSASVSGRTAHGRSSGTAGGRSVDERRDALGASPVEATPATDPYSNVPDATCRQFEDAYTGGYDLGEQPNAWAGHLLADLIGHDGIVMDLTGFTQMEFGTDLALACLDPSAFNLSTRTMGAGVYRTNKAKYTRKDQVPLSGR